MRRYFIPIVVLALAAVLLPRPAEAATDRILFAGQSTRVAYDDLASFSRGPTGGSVYYEVASGNWVSPGHQQYAQMLAQRGAPIQVGVSWKDNPPDRVPGQDVAARSRAVTQEIANGRYADRFNRLRDFVRANPQSTFYLRLDYEVSTYYHCTDASCSSYKNAFNRLRGLLAAANVKAVFHPVRGEFEQLYPGNSTVDWIGVSIFAHELCLPIYENQYLYNGTPPQNYDVNALQCRNAYIGKDQHGNDAAVWANFDFDGNVLKMMKFARDRGKPMIVSEGGMMNFTADGNDTRGLEQARGDLWMRRFFALMDYQGPIPNLSGSHDLRNVIKAATYINLDFRYGWDGVNDGSFDFPPNSTWFVDGRLSQYGAARNTFCQGLASKGFTTRC